MTIAAYQIDKAGDLVEMGMHDLGRGGRSAGQIIRRAYAALEQGRLWADIRDFAIKKDRVGLVNWPEPAPGKVLVRYFWLVAGDQTGKPAPMLTIGPAHFAYEEVDAPPAPVPDAVSARQFIEWLGADGRISVAQLATWYRDGTLPPPIVTGLNAYSGTAAAKARWLNRFMREPVFYRGDVQGDFIEILKAVFSMTDAQVDAAFTAAAAL